MHYSDHALSVLRPSVVVNFSHFRFLLPNRWTEFNQMSQVARSQCPLPSLCLPGRSENQDVRPCIWLAETLSTSLKPLKWMKRNLTGSKISTSSTNFVFFGPIGQEPRWPPWPLIGLEIFKNSLHPLNGMHRHLTGSKISTSSTICAFGPIGKPRWPSWPLNAWDFFISSLQPLFLSWSLPACVPFKS